MTHADLFFYVKGFVTLVATILLVAHMWQVRNTAMSLGRVLRYLCLLGFAVLGTAAVPEQVREGASIEGRNVAAVALFGLLVVTALISIRENLPSRSKVHRKPDETG